MTERVFDLLPDEDFELDRVELIDFDVVGDGVEDFVELAVADSLIDAEGVVDGGIIEFDLDADLDTLMEEDVLTEAVLVAVLELERD